MILSDEGQFATKIIGLLGLLTRSRGQRAVCPGIRKPAQLSGLFLAYIYAYVKFEKNRLTLGAGALIRCDKPLNLIL